MASESDAASCWSTLSSNQRRNVSNSDTALFLCSTVMLAPIPLQSISDCLTNLPPLCGNHTIEIERLALRRLLCRKSSNNDSGIHHIHDKHRDSSSDMCSKRTAISSSLSLRSRHGILSHTSPRNSSKDLPIAASGGFSAQRSTKLNIVLPTPKYSSRTDTY